MTSVSCSLSALCLASLAALAGSGHAAEIYNADGTTISAEGTAVLGVFDSQRNYDGREGGSRWREGFVKYGLSGSRGNVASGELFGGISVVTSGTWGEGDAAGLSNGRERRTSLEDAYLGWRSAEALPALGKDGLEVSAGRQVVKIGSGFLIMDDGLNLGKSPAGGLLDRGGAYYAAPRHAFASSAVLRLGGAQGLHGSAMWLKSDNPGQAKTSLAAFTLEHSSEAGTLGLTHVRGLGVDEALASPAQLERNGMRVWSMRGEGSAGIENASFSFEAARQSKSSGSDSAGYVQAGYTFAKAPWAPTLSYRITRYSANWDGLFTGGYRGWIQGEVAGNYAGPFNSNTRIHSLALTAKPQENLTLGALLFSFKTLDSRQQPRLDARELDLFAEWAVNEHLIVSPLIGLYQPRANAASGSNQSLGGRRNVYTQLMLIVPF